MNKSCSNHGDALRGMMHTCCPFSQILTATRTKLTDCSRIAQVAAKAIGPNQEAVGDIEVCLYGVSYCTASTQPAGRLRSAQTSTPVISISFQIAEFSVGVRRLIVRVKDQDTSIFGCEHRGNKQIIFQVKCFFWQLVYK
jgi:hypothetical protein